MVKKEAVRQTSDSALTVILVTGIVLIGFGALSLLSVFGILNGSLFTSLKNLMYGLSGAFCPLFCAMLFWGGALCIMTSRREVSKRAYFFSILLFLLLLGCVNLLSKINETNLLDYIRSDNQLSLIPTPDSYWQIIKAGYTKCAINANFGGALGMLLAWPVWKYAGNIVGFLILLLLFVLCVLFLFRFSFKNSYQKLKTTLQERKEQNAQQQQEKEYAERLAQQQRDQQERQRRNLIPAFLRRKENASEEPAANPTVPQQPVQAIRQVIIQNGYYYDAQTGQLIGQVPQTQLYNENIVPQANYAPVQMTMPQTVLQGATQPVQPVQSAQPVQPVQSPEKKSKRITKAEAELEKKRREQELLDRKIEGNEMARAEQSLLNETDSMYSAAPGKDASVSEWQKNVSQAVQDVNEAENTPAEPEKTARPSTPYRSVRDTVLGVQNEEEPAMGERSAYQRPRTQVAAPEKAAAVQTPKPSPQVTYAGQWNEEEPAPAPVSGSNATNAPEERKRRSASQPVSKSETQYAPPAAQPQKTDWQRETEAAMARAQNAQPVEEAPAQKQKPLASWTDEEKPAMTHQEPEGEAGKYAHMAELPPQPEDGFCAIPYEYPELSLLKAPDQKDRPDTTQMDQANAAKLKRTLESFKIPAEVVKVTHGPAVTRYELGLTTSGIKVSRITGIADNIALDLASNGGVRIEIPIPGTNLFGVEVPNAKVSMVRFSEVLGSPEMQNAKATLTVALGLDIAGKPILCDLAAMPHLLIAGQTGSGKSVCINTIINSLLYRTSPEDVRMIMVDPKVVELQCYNVVPHLLIPVVSDPHKAAGALQWAVAEMLDRYHRIEKKHVRDINGFNNHLEPGEAKMPRIVIIIDELADLMIACKKEVEESIIRLAQLARAAGIHMVVATQRPTVDVITGLIKANIPSRIAFAVTSSIDSRTILDQVGAEKLLGKGDMLYAPTGKTPMRVQGCFMTDDEIERVTSFIAENSTTNFDANVTGFLEHSEEEGDADTADAVDDNSYSDDRLEEAIDMVLTDGVASISMLQRRMGIGYPRAGRLIDKMASMGILSKAGGSKARDILMSREEWELQKAELLK